MSGAARGPGQDHRRSPALPAATLHARLTGLERRIREALATRRDALPFGEMLVTGDLPLVYDHNLVLVDAPAPAHEVIATVEDRARTAGWGHRNVETADPAIADALRAEFLAAGYREERFVTMALLRPPQAAAPVTATGATTAVVDIAAQEPLARALLAEEPWAQRADVLDQFAERERRIARVVPARAVVAPADDPASRCLLLSDGALADIDAVATLTSHRGAGLSRAVMRRAVAEARADGAEHIMLVADDRDWPRQWYGRLGFVEVGRVTQFRRWPEPA